MWGKYSKLRSHLKLYDLLRNPLWRAPTTLYGPSGLKYHPLEKTDMTADSLEIPFKSHDLCDENHREGVESRVKLYSKL